MEIRTENELAAVCLSLIAGLDSLSSPERKIIRHVLADAPSDARLRAIQRAIRAGNDPLGDVFPSIRDASMRRSSGAVYTPLPIVNSMLRWLTHQIRPGRVSRIVDIGAGSGRFILSAARYFPQATFVAVESDPLAALMLRANLQVSGLNDRVTVLVEDYRNITLPHFKGVTAFIGNPPYVRHHDIEDHWKEWYVNKFSTLGIKASALAGLHLHFFLKTRLLAQPGDLGVLITSAEWMDVNYGSALRSLLLNELGGLALHVLEPTIEAFPGTASTAAITCFRVGESRQAIKVRSVNSLPRLNSLSAGTKVPREQFQDENKWSLIVRPSGRKRQLDDIELGELFRVHRGQVTGANGVWIAGEHSKKLPERVLIPAVTKAKDIIMAGETLESDEGLRRVIDIPPELDGFTRAERRRISTFLSWARAQGADETYVAQHRKAWWSVGLKAPAPILCTYMARRPPQFTLNVCEAHHINVAHGLYPVEPLDPDVLARIIRWLNQNVSTANGRTYSGGLTKFEPKEIERVRIPKLEDIA